jgi:hypothetical protein
LTLQREDAPILFENRRTQTKHQKIRRRKGQKKKDVSLDVSSYSLILSLKGERCFFVVFCCTLS